MFFRNKEHCSIYPDLVRFIPRHFVVFIVVMNVFCLFPDTCKCLYLANRKTWFGAGWFYTLPPSGIETCFNGFSGGSLGPLRREPCGLPKCSCVYLCVGHCVSPHLGWAGRMGFHLSYEGWWGRGLWGERKESGLCFGLTQNHLLCSLFSSLSTKMMMYSPHLSVYR